GVAEFEMVGDLIGDVLDGLRDNPAGNHAVEEATRARVMELCARFPIYS
ncbi:MAG: serine hydroxymethyltransferase, partial [Pseudomonadota bacterium]|nr:serine hydroxymethyltransferase [Pseudomonadota bacterium]